MMLHITHSTGRGPLPGIAVVAVIAVAIAGCGHKNGGEAGVSANDYFHQALTLSNGGSRCTSDQLHRKEALYRKAIELNPEHAEAWNNLGDVYENLGDYVKAVEAYGKAKDLKPDMAEPYFGIGDVYWKQGSYEKAIEAYQSGLERNPKDELSKQRLQVARDALLQKQGKHLITAEVIRRGLLPRDNSGRRVNTRGVGGIVNAPTVTFDHTVLPFATDSAELLPQAKEQLDELGKVLSSTDAAGFSFEVGGHTDERGSEAHGMTLGARRAEAVKSYLAEKCGIAPERLVTKSYGESCPLPGTSGHNEACWAANRRVEIRRLDQIDIPKPRAGDLRILYGVLHAKPGGGYRLIEDHRTTVRSWDCYQIYVRPRSRCYVYLYQVDSSGKGFWLFPNDQTAAVRNPLDTNADYWFPRRDKSFALDETRGRETIYLVASRRPITNFDRLKQRADAPVEEVVASIQCRGVARVKAIEETAPAATAKPDASAVPKTALPTPTVPVKEVFGAGEFQVAVSFRHE